MVQISISSMKRNDAQNYVEMTYFMRFTLPSIFGTTTAPINGLSTILASFPDGFSLEVTKDATPNNYINYSKTISFPYSTSLATIKTSLQNTYTNIRTRLDNLTLTNYDTIASLSWDGTTWA